MFMLVIEKILDGLVVSLYFVMEIKGLNYIFVYLEDYFCLYGGE